MSKRIVYTGYIDPIFELINSDHTVTMHYHINTYETVCGLEVSERFVKETDRISFDRNMIAKCQTCEAIKGSMSREINKE